MQAGRARQANRFPPLRLKPQNLHFKHHKAPQTREDNFSLNIGFIANDPLRVVNFAMPHNQKGRAFKG